MKSVAAAVLLSVVTLSASAAVDNTADHSVWRKIKVKQATSQVETTRVWRKIKVKSVSDSTSKDTGVWRQIKL